MLQNTLRPVVLQSLVFKMSRYWGFFFISRKKVILHFFNFNIHMLNVIMNAGECILNSFLSIKLFLLKFRSFRKKNIFWLLLIFWKEGITRFCNFAWLHYRVFYKVVNQTRTKILIHKHKRIICIFTSNQNFTNKNIIFTSFSKF